MNINGWPIQSVNAWHFHPITDNFANTEEVDYDLLPPPPKLACFKQAIEALGDVQVFLEDRGYVEQATSVRKVMINLSSISDNNYTQIQLINTFHNDKF